MSVQAEPIEHQLTVEDILMMILKELKIMNARIEEGYETGIEEDDIDDC